MIRKGRASDKVAVYQLWKELFAFDDGGYTDYYFSNLYDFHDLFVLEIDGELVACLQRRKHKIMLNQKIFPTSMIVGVMTHPNHRHKGYMKALMNEVLKEAKQEELLTIIQAYDMSLYTPFGFQAVNGKQMKYYSKHADENKIELEIGYDAASMHQCFKESMKDYSGYFIRDLAYFYAYEKELLAQNFKCVRYMKNQQCYAYAIYEDDTIIDCMECMAIDQKSYDLLIASLRSQKDVKVIIPIDQEGCGSLCDNTLICIHDENRLCLESGLSKAEVKDWEANGKKWYLPEWA